MIRFSSSRWIHFVAAAVMLIATGIFAWMKPDVYQSEARILVDPGMDLDGSLSAAKARDIVESRIRSFQESMASRSIRENIIDDLSVPSIGSRDTLNFSLKNPIFSRASENTFTVACRAK